MMGEHSVAQGMLMNGGHANFTQTFNNNHYGEATQRTLLQALKFPTSGLREQTVEAQCRGTCEWFLETTEYRNWTESEDEDTDTHRMLWILGKAGSGKSTLLKFTIEQVRAHAAASDFLLTHFFNARGNMLEKSVEGMYRTILTQILDKLPSMSAAMLEAIRGWMPSEGGSWPIPTLVTLLKEAVRMLEGRKLVFFIDALDECDNEEAQEMVEGFESLIEVAGLNGQKFRVCFASRPYPHVATNCAEYFKLDNSESHEDDIKEYIETHLRIGQSPAECAVRRRTKIKKQLLVKSKHVFLWAKLVVTLLNKEYRSGRPERYDKWLQGDLDDLDKLYGEMLRQGNAADSEEDERARLLCFQWVLYHIDQGNGLTLSPERLWWGIQLGLGKDVDDIYRRSAELDDAMIRRYIINTSKGLIECHEPIDSDGGGSEDSSSEDSDFDEIDIDDSDSEDSTCVESLPVSFIHESAREFVLSQKGPLQAASRSGETLDVELQGHLQLKDCCESLLEFCRLPLINATKLCQDDPMGFLHDVVEEQKLFPLLHYARYSIFHHANTIHQLQLGGHAQGEWAATFYARFKPLSVVFMNVDPIVPEAPLFSILVESGLSALMQANCELLFKEALEGRNCHHAPGISFRGVSDRLLRKVMEEKRMETVQIIVDIYLRLEIRHHIVQDILLGLANQVFANGLRDCGFGIRLRAYDVAQDQVTRIRSVPWMDAASSSDELATFFLIALIPGAFSFSDDEAKALQRAANDGYLDALDHLIRHDIPSRFSPCTPQNDWTRKRLEEWAIDMQEVELAATLAALRTGEISYRGFIPEEWS